MKRLGILGLSLYLLGMILMEGSAPAGLRRETVAIAGPGGKPCLGTLWIPWAPERPKAVILIGHGVTCNQGVMAAMAKAFAGNGYAAVTLDFWGHGRSRERFDWQANPAQVQAWCAWAREHYKGLPLAYLGHSMGGFAGGEAFVKEPAVDAFVALGALPPHIPACKTLVAAGQFEELFSGDTARRRVADKADVFVSPYSDHILETWDPVLIQGIMNWVDKTLGLAPRAAVPWGRLLRFLLAVVIGCAGAFMLAEQAAALLPQSAPPLTPPAGRRWRINPYRITGRLLGLKGESDPPRSGSLLSALFKGVVYSAVFILLLSWLLDADMFTCGLNHPGRCLTWLMLTPVMMLLSAISIRALERLPLPNARTRFAVSSLTRGVPLILLGLALRFTPNLAFLGMVLWIFAFIFTMISVMHAMATRGAADYRAGAAASGITFAWLIAFWLPLSWPWIF